MTIYLVKECSGEYEDYHESIVYCTNNQTKAKNKKTELEQKEKQRVEQSKECQRCCVEDFKMEEYDQIKAVVELCCDKFKIRTYDDGTCGCENYFYLWDESTFRIVELECEE